MNDEFTDEDIIVGVLALRNKAFTPDDLEDYRMLCALAIDRGLFVPVAPTEVTTVNLD